MWSEILGISNSRRERDFGGLALFKDCQKKQGGKAGGGG